MVRGETRLQLLVCAPPPLGRFLGALRGTMAALPAPEGIHVAVDVDAVSMM